MTQIQHHWNTANRNLLLQLPLLIISMGICSLQPIEDCWMLLSRNVPIKYSLATTAPSHEAARAYSRSKSSYTFKKKIICLISFEFKDWEFKIWIQCSWLSEHCFVKKESKVKVSSGLSNVIWSALIDCHHIYDSNTAKTGAQMWHVNVFTNEACVKSKGWKEISHS